MRCPWHLTFSMALSADHGPFFTDRVRWESDSCLLFFPNCVNRLEFRSPQPNAHDQSDPPRNILVAVPPRSAQTRPVAPSIVLPCKLRNTDQLQRNEGVPGTPLLPRVHYTTMASESVSYPPVPPHASYASCYCEENIYLLAASFLGLPDFRESWDLTVVFISNRTKTASNPSPLSLSDAAAGAIHAIPIHFSPLATSDDLKPLSTQVALWSQQAAREERLPIVWDYHVVLVLRPVFSGPGDVGDGQGIRRRSLIYDFDTTLNLPHDAQGGYLFRRLSPRRPANPRFPNIVSTGRAAMPPNAGRALRVFDGY